MRNAIIGGQWGDEGKGKVIDYHLNHNNYFQMTARYNGGRNAGHTAVRGAHKYKLHSLPTGVLTSGLYNIILEGCVFDPVSLAGEIEGLRGMGIKITPNNLGISSRAQITANYHYAIEKADEHARGKGSIGTTLRGIGPTYTDKAARRGIRFGEFLDAGLFGMLAAEGVARVKGNQFFDMAMYKAWMKEADKSREYLWDYAVDEGILMHQRRGENILYEGAQGIMIDPGQGTYPHVTSSNVAGPPHRVDRRIGVVKAYTTRVGGGPFPSQMEPREEEITRSRGGEYGTSTNRPRNCGWFDVVQVRHAVNAGDLDVLEMTKLDVLSFPEVSVCRGYEYKGSLLRHFPENRDVFDHIKPVYHNFRGWDGDEVARARDWDDLPDSAKDYVNMLEDLLERDIVLVSVGADTEAAIERRVL